MARYSGGGSWGVFFGQRRRWGRGLLSPHRRVDDKIITMYSRGMTVREIQGFMAEMYAVDVSPNLISSVTNAVLSEVATCAG